MRKAPCPDRLPRFRPTISRPTCLGYAISKGLTLAGFNGKRLVVSIAAEIPEGDEWKFPEKTRMELLLGVTVPIERDRVDDARSWLKVLDGPKTGRLVVPRNKIKKPW